MKTNSQNAKNAERGENIANIHTPGDDTFTDDEREIRNGLYRHALAHGEVVNG